MKSFKLITKSKIIFTLIIVGIIILDVILMYTLNLSSLSEDKTIQIIDGVIIQLLIIFWGRIVYTIAFIILILFWMINIIKYLVYKNKTDY
ncbi:MAG: hypothetical protein PHD15_03105 [Clostridia bacterium]|nr:hypothetical protein [Clostridia bacterium]MDD4386734.1 hypothetical protein [Clostridia bacterium]